MLGFLWSCFSSLPARIFFFAMLAPLVFVGECLWHCFMCFPEWLLGVRKDFLTKEYQYGQISTNILWWFVNSGTIKWTALILYLSSRSECDVFVSDVCRCWSRGRGTLRSWPLCQCRVSGVCRSWRGACRACGNSRTSYSGACERKVSRREGWRVRCKEGNIV